MLARYRIVRGRRPPDDPLPDGLRVDIRRHTRHALAPTREMVDRYLRAVSDETWERFRRDYLELLEDRFTQDPEPFADLASRARDVDVYLGCNCPTAKNPDVNRCHTVAALTFMGRHFPDLEVRLPRKPA